MNAVEKEKDKGAETEVAA